MRMKLPASILLTVLSLVMVSSAYSMGDSLLIPQGFSVRFSFGTQTLVSGSTESLYNDMIELREDKLSPLSSTNIVDPKSSFGAAVTFYGAGEKNIYAIFRVERQGYQRQSTFNIKTTDLNGNNGSASASIVTEHRVYPLMLGGGWYMSTKQSSLRFEMDVVFAFATIDETMSVEGFPSTTGEINGNGFGGRASVSLNIPIVQQAHFIVDANYSYHYIAYSPEKRNYSGERTFSYYGFGVLAGLEFFIF